VREVLFVVLVAEPAVGEVLFVVLVVAEPAVREDLVALVVVGAVVEVIMVAQFVMADEKVRVALLVVAMVMAV